MEPRTIKMADDQVREAMRHNARDAAARRLVEEFISSMVNQMADGDGKFWDGVARLFGYADLADATAQGVNFKICWVTRSFVAEPIGDGK